MIVQRVQKKQPKTTPLRSGGYPKLIPDQTGGVENVLFPHSLLVPVLETRIFERVSATPLVFFFNLNLITNEVKF